ncbi:MAG: biotin-dependent carboxyltransferase family protein [Nocardioides sp.]
MIRVIAAGPLSTVQDLGRCGYGHLGVSQSGAADQASHRRANRLVANSANAATIEVALGGLELVSEHPVYVALTGAPGPAEVAGTSIGMNAPVPLPAGGLLRLGWGASGARTYVAVRGGFDVPPVLGSRATDTMSGIGPAPLVAGAVVQIGALTSGLPQVDQAPVPDLIAEPTVRLLPGPRRDWLTDEAASALVRTSWTVSTDSNRVGVRLDGIALQLARTRETHPEGLIPGALQVPPNGLPIAFLADHPVTGGYPVVAAARAADLPIRAQLRPGQRLRFSWATRVPPRHHG